MINLIERTIFMKYYGIYGSNGCGVYTDYEKALKGLLFLHRRNQKCFSNRSDAENFAILGWSEYNYWASFLKKLPLNYTIYNNQLEKYL